MTVVEALKNVLTILNGIHILGGETSKYEAAKNGIQSVIDALQNTKEVAQNHAD